MRKVGLFTIPRISDDQRYPSAAAARTIWRTAGRSEYSSRRPSAYASSFSLTVVGNRSGCCNSSARRPARPSTDRSGRGGARGIHGSPRLVNRPPSPDRIEMFEREAGRIDHRVAAGAGWIGPMQGETLADGRNLGAGPYLRQRGVDVRRRWRHLDAEDVVEQPFPAQHRRGAVGIRRGSQQRAVREEATALIGVRERDPPEAGAVDAGNAVVTRQTFVDEGVVRA